MKIDNITIMFLKGAEGRCEFANRETGTHKDVNRVYAQL